MKKSLLIAGGFLVVILLGKWVSFYSDWLWFDNLHFSSIFLKVLLSKYGLGVATWLLLILFIYLSLNFTERLTRGDRPEVDINTDEKASPPISRKTLRPTMILVILFVSFVFTSIGAGKWDVVLRFFYQVPFGETDPIFNKDIGLYVFSLPFYSFISFKL